MECEVELRIRQPRDGPVQLKMGVLRVQPQVTDRQAGVAQLDQALQVGDGEARVEQEAAEPPQLQSVAVGTGPEASHEVQAVDLIVEAR